MVSGTSGVNGQLVADRVVKASGHVVELVLDRSMMVIHVLAKLLKKKHVAQTIVQVCQLSTAAQ